MLDTRTPSVARAYDHLLGGEASFAADRALAGRLLALYPRLQDTLISSRRQVADAVARIARHGVDQYLDIGAGLPTRPSTHATAQAVLPAARVVYIDRDPVVLEHATDLVAHFDRDPVLLEHGTDLVAHADRDPVAVEHGTDFVAPIGRHSAVVERGAELVPADVRYCGGDLSEPEALLAALAGTVDFSRPVCLVLALMVQALEPGTARAVVGVLVRALPPGSYLVATIGAGEDGRLPDSVWPAVAAEADLTAFFGGLDLLPPGVTRLGAVLSGVGMKPYPRRPRG